MSGGGGKGLEFSGSGEMLLFDVFARRPDVNKVLKCAKSIGGPILKLVTLRENRIVANNRFSVSCKVI